MGVFQQLVEGGMTVLMVTHDRELSRRAGQVVHLADGRIVDDRS
jgi:putative ABC transport system ATP-binding protein